MIEPISAIRVNQISQVSNPSEVLRRGVLEESNPNYFANEEVDSFVNSDSSVLEKKYNLACQVAAYYKTQYENLLKNGECIA